MDKKDECFMNLDGYNQVVNECRELGVRKNRDYSRYIDNIGITGVEGIVVRLIDKAVRAYNLTRPGEQAEIKSESLQDTFQDMINYSVYAIMIMRGLWKINNKRDRDSLVDEIIRKDGVEKFINKLADAEKKFANLKVGCCLRVLEVGDSGVPDDYRNLSGRVIVLRPNNFLFRFSLDGREASFFYDKSDGADWQIEYCKRTGADDVKIWKDIPAPDKDNS